MAICSYLLLAEPGAAASLVRRLSALPGCDVARAENRDLLLVVTDSSCPEEEAALRDTIAGLDDVRALVLTFGDLDPETPLGDPVAELDGRRRLPVLPRREPSAAPPRRRSRGVRRHRRDR